LLGGDSDARVPHAEVQRGVGVVALLASDIHDHFPLFGELDGVTNKVDQHLPQTRRVAAHPRKAPSDPAAAPAVEDAGPRELSAGLAEGKRVSVQVRGKKDQVEGALKGVEGVRSWELSETEGTIRALITSEKDRRAEISRVLVQAGIRSLTTDERALIRDAGITTVFGHELEEPNWMDRVVDALGEDVYVTVDVDYFDPSLMPSTGTPEPGGGTWYPTLTLLERVFRERRVVGCDVVELAPLPGVVAPDVLAAKLLYKLIAFFARHGQSGPGAT